ncbi:MAG: hypothetical protein Q8N18_21235 [Opitutaceae bacterium]|nr:hypothetical protein [Opitutaceae bacterium]
MAEMLSIEAIPSQSTLSRLFAQCGRRRAGEALSGWHPWALADLPGWNEDCTLDWDSFLLMHEDGQQAGVRVGCTCKGLKPCHRPIVAALAGSAAGRAFWLRPGNTACVSGAGAFLGDTRGAFAHGGPRGLGARRQWLLHPRHDRRTRDAWVEVCILTAALRAPVRTLWRYDDAAWTPTAVPGIEV